MPARPFDVVGIDLLQLTRRNQGSTYVLVCVDHFSRFTVLAPLSNKSATTVAHATASHLICPCTTPRVLLSDNGTEFKNQVLQEICTRFNIQQTFITSHHSASNGSLNVPAGKSLRFCATLLDIYAKHGRIGFLTLLPLLMTLSILPQAKRLTTSCMGLSNASITMCLCTLLFPCTPKMIILNCSVTASK